MNSSSFDGSNDLIELSDDDEFDEAMAEVISKLYLYRDVNRQCKTFSVFCLLRSISPSLSDMLLVWYSDVHFLLLVALIYNSCNLASVYLKSNTPGKSCQCLHGYCDQ